MISWAYTPQGCVSTGSARGEWSWFAGSGWSLGSHGGSGSHDCSRFRGRTYATFSNSAFCWPLPTVYTYYYYVDAYGWSTGNVGGSRSTDSVNECAPLWMHYQLVKTT